MQTKPPAEPKPEMMLPYHANIMVLDGNIPLARTVQRILGAQFTVHVAENFQHVVELMDSHEIGLILADLRDLRSYNVTMLKILKKNYPLAVSIVLTDQVDAKLGIQLINQGQIFRFITNDNRDELRETLVEGLRYYQHTRKNPAVINRHSVEPAADIETVRLQTQLIDRLPNIRRKMAALLASSG